MFSTKTFLYTIIIAIVLSLLFLVFYESDSSRQGQKVSYNEQIRPILSDKCFVCHGPDRGQNISEYRLDEQQYAYEMLTGAQGTHGIVPFHPEKSDVYHRILSDDPSYMMPPPESNLTLTEEEKNLITLWIKEGAIYQKHWAFLPVTQPEIPTSKHAKWAVNEIDFFILDKMTQNNLTPSNPEDKERLLKRVLHDITGLPPTLAQQDQYINDNSDDAYEKIVDEALASPNYGEKMAIFWMDLARYADSHGYQDDGLRTMWPWRDWVIHAFNQNYSYKKFVTLQLAGDLLHDTNKEAILATGFNRNHKITQEGGVIDEEYRVEYVTDRTNTLGKGILALTLECAKCHTHKYDPITHEDYFKAFAFFNQVPEKGLYGDISIASLADPPYMTITQKDKDGILKFLSKIDTQDVRVMIMKDDSIYRKTHVLNRGMYDQPTKEVQPSMPSFILPYDTLNLSRDRVGLSQWLFDKSNPLTARVFVNHIWKEFFGTGLVKTTGDFGLQGDLPSHPELLDWLAFDFMENGWDIKRLVKQLTMSSTYRQSTRYITKKHGSDPENVWLSRGPRIKLSAELIKDHILASSGLINLTIGGPSVKPYQPKGLWESASSGRGQLAQYIPDKGSSLYRRGLYHFIKRTVPPPGMLIFDASNRDQCEVDRSKTSTPLQSLVLMNDPAILEASAFLAQTLLKNNDFNIEQCLKLAFRRVLCRFPSKAELKHITEFYNQNSQTIKINEALLLLEVSKKIDLVVIEKPIETAALMQSIHLMYNLEEAMMR